jgi:hypothetical protein
MTTPTDPLTALVTDKLLTDYLFKQELAQALVSRHGKSLLDSMLRLDLKGELSRLTSAELVTAVLRDPWVREQIQAALKPALAAAISQELGHTLRDLGQELSARLLARLP